MHHEMRRKDRAMPQALAEQLLSGGEYGILSTVDLDNQPYGVPLSYIFINGAIYFHCALTGQKLENIHQENKVCFTVVGNTQPVYDNNFTTFYESVIAFGEASEVCDEEEKTAALMGLCEKYLPKHMDKAKKDIESAFAITKVYKIAVSHFSGKAKRKK